MIKNAKNLSSAETRQFALAYTMYFRNNCVFHYTDDKVDSKELLHRGAPSFARKMIQKIKNGSRIGFVNMEGALVNGFVVGNVGELDCGWISHLYSDTGDSIADKIVLGNLFIEFANEMKRLGMKEIITDCEKDDPKLQSQLEGLDFQVESKEGSLTSYGRHI